MKNKASFSNKVYRKIHWILFSKIKPGAGIRWCYPAYRHGMKYRKRKVQMAAEELEVGAEVRSKTEQENSAADRSKTGRESCVENQSNTGQENNVADRSKTRQKNEAGNITKKESTVYLTQVPNEGAGIGHQIANYIGGVHYARIFGAKHAHAGFKDAKWELFFGFGEGEVSVEALKKQGYKMLRLPYFDEEKDAAIIRDIIASYEGQKVILQTELDQFYEKQYEEMAFIKKKFEGAKARQNEKDSFDEKDIHIAVHIRRGDIVEGQTTGEQTLTKRWLTMEYYENAVQDVVSSMQDGDLLTGHANAWKESLPDIFRKLEEKKGNGGEIILHIFSQGKKEDYTQFEQFGKVDYCLDKDAMESFLMMVRADILILSKSSFSYKPALLADGIRICPPHFWHGYPDTPDWMVAEEDGHLGES